MKSHPLEPLWLLRNCLLPLLVPPFSLAEFPRHVVHHVFWRIHLPTVCPFLHFHFHCASSKTSSVTCEFLPRVLAWQCCATYLSFIQQCHEPFQPCILLFQPFHNFPLLFDFKTTLSLLPTKVRMHHSSILACNLRQLLTDIPSQTFAAATYCTCLLHHRQHVFVFSSRPFLPHLQPFWLKPFSSTHLFVCACPLWIFFM